MRLVIGNAASSRRTRESTYWRHFRGATTASGIHETYDPGHASEIGWYLPDEAAEEF